ncbi:hypothetical protein STCU_07646, partial [Strigomonas culicis]
MQSHYTPAELSQRYDGMDFVYSFVNGTEVNHFYRRDIIANCWVHIEQEMERRYAAWRRPGGAADGDAKVLSCLPPYVEGATLGALLSSVRGSVRAGARDHEVGELRYSIRSVERHLPWHRGRLVLVSPGHTPGWLDGARNFLAGACGGAGRRPGEHARLTTVHQDALLPHGARLTVNSHVIEKFLWRVRGLTPVHVYFNDDYFVNRPAAVTDFVNEYGGTIIRTEGGVISPRPVKITETHSWAEGVVYTSHFITQELDERAAEAVPASYFARLQTMTAELNTTLRALTAAQKAEIDRRAPSAEAALPLDFDMDRYLYWAYEFPPTPLAVNYSRNVTAPRYYVTHAPFTYCTNMFRFFAVRYADFFADVARHRPRRSLFDLYMPFVYNAFALSRPWMASPRFLAYVHEVQAAAGRVNVSATITMDNKDGCAPPTLLRGMQNNGCLFAKLTDNATRNAGVFANIELRNPLFFNINGQFSDEVGATLRDFLDRKFPDPIFLDAARPDLDDDAAALRETYAALMRLPLVLVAAHEANVCGLLRSLQL